PDAVAVIRERLMPLASIVTPNLAEAEVLIGQQPDFGHARSPHRSEERDDREGPGKRLAGLATQLLNLGSAAVYLKGGQRLYTSDAPHDPGAVSTSTGVDVQQVGGDRPRESIDVFHDGQQIHMLSGPLVSTRALHGTGCSLSSALASLLALGRSPFDAAREAKVWLTRAIERGSELDVGHPDGFGPVHHFHSKRSAASEPE
ncbi:MAG: bifunctional hydroxymethylpyrimidine kinase/phosphomethylpyrimidine kinase, partial [Planctomycetota bacterium]